MQNIETELLILKCREGDDRAIESLIEHHKNGVYRLALSILDDPTEADEATQDVFITALGALETYQGKAKLSTWLYTITLNLCRNRLRKRRTLNHLTQRLQNIFQTSGNHQAPLEEIVIQTEAETVLWDAIQNLGEKHRVVIILRYYHNFHISEISEILNVSVGTVHSRLHTARTRLQDTLHKRKYRIDL